MSQLTFDIDQMLLDIERDALPAWEGMPMFHFTTAYYSPAEHEAMFARRKVEARDWTENRHPWNRAYCLDLPGATANGHTFVAYSADLRCKCLFGYRTVSEYEAAGWCRCVGELLTKVVCDGCSWHHIGTESQAVEAWHDHAFPGWRDLPMFPVKLRGQMGSRELTAKRKAWLNANYPIEFRTPLAPILTSRQKFGHRHVPGYSPYGGFDLAADDALVGGVL
jgi:hypothetical protein